VVKAAQAVTFPADYPLKVYSRLLPGL